MKSFIVLIAFMISSVCIAGQPTDVSTGEVFAAGHYLDNFNGGTVAPSLGMRMRQELPFKLELAEVVHGGYISQPVAADGTTPLGLYGGVNVEVSEYGLFGAAPEALKISVGGGLESNRSFYNSYSDYVHLEVAYKLW